VLQVVDDALRSATKAEKKTLKDVDEKFKKAIDELSAYEKRHDHYNAEKPVAERMKTAEETDTSSLKFLNRLKETWQVREEFAPFFGAILLY
jgi:ribosomal protein S21